MPLQEDFFNYIKQHVDQHYPNWEKRATEQWYKCYAQDRAIIWVKKPNRDGSFWVFISIPLSQVLLIPHLITNQDRNEDKKYHVSLRNVPMTPIILLDRGSPARNQFEANWPIGFKLEDATQFNLAKQIIIAQWE